MPGINGRRVSCGLTRWAWRIGGSESGEQSVACDCGQVKAVNMGGYVRAELQMRSCSASAYQQSLCVIRMLPSAYIFGQRFADVGRSSVVGG